MGDEGKITAIWKRQRDTKLEVGMKGQFSSVEVEPESSVFTTFAKTLQPSKANDRIPSSHRTCQDLHIEMVAGEETYFRVKLMNCSMKCAVFPETERSPGIVRH